MTFILMTEVILYPFNNEIKNRGPKIKKALKLKAAKL